MTRGDAAIERAKARRGFAVGWLAAVALLLAMFAPVTAASARAPASCPPGIERPASPCCPASGPAAMTQCSLCCALPAALAQIAPLPPMARAGFDRLVVADRDGRRPPPADPPPRA